MRIMTKTTIVATAMLFAATPAVFAQDAEPEVSPPVETVDVFTAADVDADGALDRDEFVSYVVMQSDAGDVDYTGLKLSGEYDNAFNTKDYNADGLLSAEELTMPEGDDAIETPEPSVEESVDEAG